MLKSNYDKFPAVSVLHSSDEIWSGWKEIFERLNSEIASLQKTSAKLVLAIECYTGLHEDTIAGIVRDNVDHDSFFLAGKAFKSPSEIDTMLKPFLGGDDPIFGYMCPLTLDDFYDAEHRRRLAAEIAAKDGVTIVFGSGALLVCDANLVVYADMPRWEGQLRQRRGEVTNLGAQNKGLKGSLQYKRSYFVDWRVCDRLKTTTMKRWDFVLDTTKVDEPKMVSGRALRAALSQAAQQPFRVVPYFDMAPWGGQWLKEVCELDRSTPNFGWGFDCVPEENSLLLQFDDTTFETPAQNLVYYQPRELLGNPVYGLFGPEFPIRFDFLDTISGGNLSLQVHPLVAYAQEKFGIHYTQDESYYILDAKPGATVYLGVKTNVDEVELFDALDDAQSGKGDFDAEKFVNKWPAKTHDHFLIPSGTIHCSGSETVVLEISATPYIFTFKLWDWGRLGLDGLPRPINIKHGRRVLQTDRETKWADSQLINVLTPISGGDGWREERTGLHSLEFIETRRHWFTGKVDHDTYGTVNVLNLVQGHEAIIESPNGKFAPYIVHYAETFIVPAAVGPYTIRPHGEAVGSECATIKAFVTLGNPVGM
jgi:mannose-6-phosphate isomerase class I